MADFIKCSCPACHVSYRLPSEFGGRTARCKKCNAKFEVPRPEKSIDDSVLDWLSDGGDEADETVAQPRVIQMNKDGGSGSDPNAPKSKAIIRLKEGQTPKPGH